MSDFQKWRIERAVKGGSKAFERSLQDMLAIHGPALVGWLSLQEDYLARQVAAPDLANREHAAGALYQVQSMLAALEEIHNRRPSQRTGTPPEPDLTPRLD